MLRARSTASLMHVLALISAIFAPMLLSFESSCHFPLERLSTVIAKWGHLVCSVLYCIIAFGQWRVGTGAPYGRLATATRTALPRGRSRMAMEASALGLESGSIEKTVFLSEPGDWFVFDFFAFAGLAAEAVHLMEEPMMAPTPTQYIWLLSAFKVWRWFVPHDVVDDVRSHAVEGFWLLVLQLFTNFFLFTHICACILGWAAIVQIGSDTTSWADETGSLGHEVRSCTDFYVAAFYFAAYTVTSIGHGDIVPANNWERGVDACVMIISQMYVAKLFADLNFIISTHNHWRAQRHQRLTQTGAALASMGVPMVLRKRVLAYQDFVWEVQKERRAKESLRDLSDSLREELQTIVYQRLVSHAPFLHQLSVEALRHILSSLTDAVYLPSDFIIRRGADGAELYFMREGTAGIFLTAEAPKWHDTEVKVLSRGDYFGEVALMTGQKRTSWVMARYYCVCSMLRKSVIDEVMDRDPSCVVTLATSMKQALNLAPKLTWRDVAEKVDKNFIGVEDLAEWLSCYHVVPVSADGSGGIAASYDMTWSRYRSLMTHLKIPVLDQKLLWIDLDQEERGAVSLRRFVQVAYGGHRDDEANEFLNNAAGAETPQSGPSSSTGGRPSNMKWGRGPSRSCLMQTPGSSRRASNAGFGMAPGVSMGNRMSMGNLMSAMPDRQALLLQMQIGVLQDKMETRFSDISEQVDVLMRHFNLKPPRRGPEGDDESEDDESKKTSDGEGARQAGAPVSPCSDTQRVASTASLIEVKSRHALLAPRPPPDPPDREPQPPASNASTIDVVGVPRSHPMAVTFQDDDTESPITVEELPG